MLRNWVLEVKPKPDVLCAVHVGAAGEKGTIVASCRSVDELREEIARIKVELDAFLEDALQKLAGLEGGGSGVDDPERVWKEMEAMPTEREMFSLFNAFSAADRRVIAEYILTHVNMFKGRGPVFSEHYDAESHLLE